VVLVSVIERSFIGFEFLHYVAVHVDLFVGVAQFLANTLDLFLIVFGRVFERGAPSAALQFLLGDLFGQLLILLLERFDQFSVNLSQSLNFAVLLEFLPTFFSGLALVFVIANATAHDKNIMMRK
jgi:hypothetical protein